MRGFVGILQGGVHLRKHPRMTCQTLVAASQVSGTPQYRRCDVTCAGMFPAAPVSLKRAPSCHVCRCPRVEECLSCVPVIMLEVKLQK